MTGGGGNIDSVVISSMDDDDSIEALEDCLMLMARDHKERDNRYGGLSIAWDNEHKLEVPARRIADLRLSRLIIRAGELVSTSIALASVAWRQSLATVARLRQDSGQSSTIPRSMNRTTALMAGYSLSWTVTIV